MLNCMTFHAWDRLAFVFLLVLSVVAAISPALAEVGAVALIVAWAVTQFSPAYRAFWKKIPVVLLGLLLIFALWGIGVSALSQRPWDSLRHCASKWGEWIVVMLAVCSTLSSKRRMRIFFIVLIAGSFLMAFDGAWQYIFGKDLLRGKPLLYGMYSTASFPYYTIYACYVVTLFLIGVGLRLKRQLSLRENIFLTVHHVVFLLILVFTFSRAAWLGAVIGLAGLALWRERKLSIFIAGGIGLLLLLSPTGVTFRFKEFFSGSWGGYRPEIWQATLTMIHDQWWGVGINNFSHTITRYYPSGGYAHNSLLQLAAEFGIPGVILFLSLFLGIFISTLRKFYRDFSFEAAAGYATVFALVGFLVHAFFDNHLFNEQLAVLFWMLSGSLLAIVILPSNRSCP
ncbi:MAG: O-antigen ligase family protein [Candidatus Omnitrophica bacterium]|nr:O-antigen ligase family protein [Candidatus Omnitrophota bacterium]MDD5672128.1 O-antigen ligase family protein [Candidatus Omnitrophota bacterium]